MSRDFSVEESASSGEVCDADDGAAEWLSGARAVVGSGLAGGTQRMALVYRRVTGRDGAVEPRTRRRGLPIVRRRRCAVEHAIDKVRGLFDEVDREVVAETGMLELGTVDDIRGAGGERVFNRGE